MEPFLAENDKKMFYRYLDNAKIYFEYDEDEIKPHLLNTLNIELEKAESNFENHLSRVLDSITKSIDSEFEDDDRIIDRIDSQEILFDKEGNPEE